jgi:Transposase IS116/IS110/IS902 family
LAHGPQTHRHDNLPELGKTIASKAHRDGVAGRCADAAVQKRIEVDLALIPYHAQLLGAVALSIVKAAKHRDANPLSWWQTVPGLGQRLRLVLLYDSHDLERVPRGQAFVSYGRPSKGATEAAGKRLGTAGKNSGSAHRQWACAEAAALVLRRNPEGQSMRARVEKRPDKGKALPIRAHTRARAVSSLRKRQMAFDRATCRHR